METPDGSARRVGKAHLQLMRSLDQTCQSAAEIGREVAHGKPGHVDAFHFVDIDHADDLLARVKAHRLDPLRGAGAAPGDTLCRPGRGQACDHAALGLCDEHILNGIWAISERADQHMLLAVEKLVSNVIGKNGHEASPGVWAGNQNIGLFPDQESPLECARNEPRKNHFRAGGIERISEAVN